MARRGALQNRSRYRGGAAGHGLPLDILFPIGYTFNQVHFLWA